MDMFLYMSIGVVFLIMILLFVIFTRMLSRENFYTVFAFPSEDKLMVCTGLPVTYDIASIEMVTFSVWHRRRNYMGVFRITLVNGRKSRPFLFDYSACSKKFVLISTRQDIEEAAVYLIDLLKKRHIPARFTQGC